MIDIKDFEEAPVRSDCLQHAAEVGLPEGGLMAEFGVFKGTSIRMLAQLYPTHPIHGFDSFEGLPSEWRRGEKKISYPTGHFDCQGEMPEVPENVILHKGWFEDTLPPFLERKKDHVFRLLDIDCDIYVSTKQILTLCNDFIKPGTAIYLDELSDWGGCALRYVGWEDHEYKALLEWCEEFGREVRAISRNGAYGAAAVVEK